MKRVWEEYTDNHYVADLDLPMYYVPWDTPRGGYQHAFTRSSYPRHGGHPVAITIRPGHPEDEGRYHQDENPMYWTPGHLSKEETEE